MPLRSACAPAAIGSFIVPQADVEISMNCFIGLLKTRIRLFRPAPLVVALALLAATAATQCLAYPPQLIFPNVVGFWFGEFASDIGPAGFTSLRIEAQDA